MTNTDIMALKETKKVLTESDFTFGLKLKFEKKFGVVDNQVYMTCTENGANKYYCLRVLNRGNSSSTNYTVEIHFGRIGTNGNYKRHGFSTIEEASFFMGKKTGEKLKKGYKVVNNFNFTLQK